MASLQRRIESSREQLVDVSSVLTQRLAQQESLQRLIVAAEERLNREKEAKEQIQQELEYATSEEEKQHAQDRLRSISDRINELIEELKQRNNMTKKVTSAIEDYQKSKSRISTKIHHQTRSKHTLQKLIKKRSKPKKIKAKRSKPKKIKTKIRSKTKKIKTKIRSKTKKIKAKIKTKRKTSKKIQPKNKKKTKKAKQKKRSKSRRRK